jgi:hypothetical protein
MPLLLSLQKRAPWATVSLATLLCSCGVGLEANPFLLDPVPTGTLKYQGQFENCYPGKTVSGLAQVYQTATGEVLRLQSLSVQSDGQDVTPGLLSVVAQHTTGSTSKTLRSGRGNQNYTLNSLASSSLVWTTVSLRPIENPNSPAYCSATLSGTN